jgi:dihydrofolate reductase
MLENDPQLSLIVARAKNNVIGRDGDLPWRLPDDLAHFKKVTSGKPVIMGRATWESLPRRPLPGRQNIVLTRDWTYAAQGARVFSQIGAALAVARAVARRDGEDEFFVIGGAELFQNCLPLADRIYLTEVDAEPEGDVFFEHIDWDEWEEIGHAFHEADARNDHDFVIRTLQRVR